MSMLEKLKHRLKKRLNTLPFTCCILCGIQHSNSDKLLCQPCNKSLPYRSRYCHQCGHTFSQTHPNLCRHCLKQGSPFDDVFSLFHYKPPVDYFIKQLKFQQRLLYADLLGHKMANALAEYIKQAESNINLPSAILPVPLHRRRLRNRGFNQALEIAKPIAKKLNIPLITNTLIRSRYTQAQTELDAHQRSSNLNNSFCYQPTIPYKNIALVDDVMTTGATLDEATKTLKKHAGVENVYVWVCACVEDGINSSTS